MVKRFSNRFKKQIPSQNIFQYSWKRWLIAFFIIIILVTLSNLLISSGVFELVLDLFNSNKYSSNLQKHNVHLIDKQILRDGVVELSPSILYSIQNHTRTILKYGIRVPDDTDGYKKTKLYLEKNAKKLKHATSYFDTSHQKTPLGMKYFSNFIIEFGDRSISTKKEIIFSAHYESKIIDHDLKTGKKFLGATDSVVSCAILLELASWIDNHWNEIGADAPFHFTFVFFDGEEAFIEWTQEDSLYGSRALSKKWEVEGRLKKIEVLLLLDLIGGKDASYLNYPFHPQNYFSHLIQCEKSILQRIEDENLFFNPKFNSQILPNKGPGYIDDDHTPFLQKYVKIIHLIPYPFPDVWHTLEDDWENIDWDSSFVMHASLMQFIATIKQMNR